MAVAVVEEKEAEAVVKAAEKALTIKAASEKDVVAQIEETKKATGKEAEIKMSRVL